MSGKNKDVADPYLERFQTVIGKAENADTERSRKKFLRSARDWAYIISEKESGETAEKWQELGGKCEEKIDSTLGETEEIGEGGLPERNSDNTAESGNSGTGFDRLQGGPVTFEDPPDRSFEDVGGMHELISRLKEKVIYQIEDSPYRDALGVSPTNGVLLQGPPGTGKTYISKALAGELGYNYAEVKSSDLISRYVGESGKAVNTPFVFS